ncbi:MAG: hypothetical protein ACYTHJ_06705 [Planctomycetota bacterium]|jgi:hypothetical protein
MTIQLQPNMGSRKLRLAHGIVWLLAIAGIVLADPYDASPKGDPGNDGKPSTMDMPVEMPFSSLNSGTAVYPSSSIILLGHSIVGESANPNYRLRVGSIDGLVPIRQGDFNRNRSIELGDWNPLADCLQGPGVPISEECRRGDFNEDNDCDLADTAVFQRRMAAN